MNGDPGHADEIARLAARYLHEARASSIDEAVEMAARELGIAPRGARPSRARLRAHAQAIEESERGAPARSARIAAAFDELLGVLSVIEEVLLVLDRDASDHGAPRAYGRAVRGEFDLDPTVHVRVVTDVPAFRIAQALSDAGLGETEVRPVLTRHGHLDEIRFTRPGAGYRVMRIPPRAGVDAARDLHKGLPIESADYQDLLGRLPRSGPLGT